MNLMTMKTIRTLAAVACLILLPLTVSYAQPPKGHLIIVGGGGRTKAITQAIIDLSGGPDAKILVIATASGNPAGAAKSFITEIQKSGVKNLTWIAPTRAQSEDAAFVRKALDGVGGIYFTGGSQKRITDTLQGTLFHKELMKFYENGGMIGGTSAGAAMMSEIMITGSRIDGSDEAFNTIAPKMVETTVGMGFLKGVIVDQHFLKRSRENRLFSVAFDHPDYVCMGIDEATALIVSNGTDIEIVGRSSVTVIEPSGSSIKVDPRSHYGGEARVLLLFEGDRYQVK